MEEKQQLDIFFFPMMAQGHILPYLDMAKLFASGGSVKSTIITTPLNSIAISNSIKASNQYSQIDIQILDFPETSDVPEGIENLDQCTSNDMIVSFIKATSLFQEPLECLIQELQPDCLVADMFFPWATTSAAKFDIPRLVFSGSSFFVMCAAKSVSLYKPFMEVASDSDLFLVPTLPHQIKLTPTQIDPREREQSYSEFSLQAKDCDLHCYGVIVNSFYDLEADYINHFKNVWKQKAWHIGPLSLHNTSTDDKLSRGKNFSINESESLIKWLDSQNPNSVIYICFGSETHISSTQLNQLALGIEASQQPFIWVTRKRKNQENEDNYKWLPEGFEERIKGKGLIIRGWAPQVLILDHEAVGGFVTHCGWNSTLEAICSGVPMVTWPGFADQFYNEKLVTDVLRIGVSVGAKEWIRAGNRVESEGLIGCEVIEKAVKMLMVGEDGDEMRKRAKELKEKAKRAVEEGGSSYDDLNDLVQELTSFKLARGLK